MNDQRSGRLFSSFLTSEGIENQLEISSNTDWGSSNYGDVTCRIWIYNEDDVDAAMKWLETFETQPENPVFRKGLREAPKPILSLVDKKAAMGTTQPRSILFQKGLGSVTFAFIIICTTLFFFTEMTSPRPDITSIPATLPLTPLLSSSIKKELLFDYPKAFTFIDKLVKIYGISKLQNPQDLPPEGRYILNQFYKTPYWQGFYDILLRRIRHPEEPMEIKAELFERIRQGEVWRLFSPCLLHNDILHLLFNMLWLSVLGKQIGQRLTIMGYILFALMTGIFSNTCQYLMSGANFIGFSGILCAMLTFIWMRQKIAPWEGYPLQRGTIVFMLFFIFSMFLIQLTSFYLEYDKQLSISPGIANTAHLSGAALGLLLGRFSFFSWRS